MSGGALTFAVQAVADTSGTASLRVQNPTAPPLAWCKVNVIVDVNGSPSCAMVVDGVTVDQAGGPQPQLGPAVFTGSQNVNVIVTGAQPGSQIVAHVSGAWDDSLANLDAISTLSGGTISAAQLVGSPFLEASSQTILAGATYTSAVFPLLGYSSVFVQAITTLGSLTTMPTITLQWLDNSTPPVKLFQGNWQAQKIIDIVAAWGQQCQLSVVNNDGAHPCTIALTLIPIASSPPRKADALTYKQTATNELVGIQNTPCAHLATISASTPAGLGYAGPATLWCDPDPGNNAANSDPNYLLELTYGPTGTGKTLCTFNYCPQLFEQIDLPGQPLTINFTNGAANSTTPSISVFAGYR